MRAPISCLALVVAVTSFAPAPAWAQNACDKIASDWDALERELAQNEADMAKEDSAVRASVLATQNQTIYNKGDTLSSAAQRFKCTKVYVAPDSRRYIKSARSCTALKMFNREIDRILKDGSSTKYSEQCDQSKWEPVTSE